MSDWTKDYAKKCNGAKLMAEIQSSAVTVAVRRVDVVGDVTYVVMKAVPTSDEITLIDGLVAAHDPLLVEDQKIVISSIVENQKYAEYGFDLTFKVKPFLYTIPDSVGPHVFDISFKYPIMILGGTIDPASGNVGDSVKFEAPAEMVVGQLTSACTEGDNHIHVNEDAANLYMWKGYTVCAVTLDQYGQIATSTGLGEIISKTGTQINLFGSLTAQQAFSAGTYLSILFESVEKYKLTSTNTIWISRDTDRGTIIPADTKLRFSYWNDIGGAKEIQIVLEYYI